MGQPNILNDWDDQTGLRRKPSMSFAAISEEARAAFRRATDLAKGDEKAPESTRRTGATRSSLRDLFKK
jgi:hypothetical protein